MFKQCVQNNVWTQETSKGKGDLEHYLTRNFIVHSGHVLTGIADPQTSALQFYMCGHVVHSM